MILRSCGHGDLANILLPQKIGDLVILRSCGDGDLPSFLVMRICLNLEQKGLKIVIFALKILGDLIIIFLVIGDLRIHLVMVILAIFGW